MHQEMYKGMPYFKFLFYFNCISNIIVLSQAQEKKFGYAPKHKSPMGFRIQLILYCMARIFFSLIFKLRLLEFKDLEVKMIGRC